MTQHRLISANESSSSRQNGNAQVHKDNEKSSAEGIILGGSIRGALGLLGSTFKFKVMVYKRAFLTIGDQAMGRETSVTQPPRRFAHSKLVVYSQSMLMGIVVFGTYDGLVHAWRNNHDRKEFLRNGGEDDIAKPSPIWVHGTAGAASGLSRSLFWVGWERFVYHIPHNIAFSYRTTVHHAIGHGVLFGGYYGLRKILLESRSKKQAISGNDEDDEDDDDYYPIFASFLAGGWAGQLHHVVQHYTSHWREFRHHQIPRPPRIRPSMAAFAPMAMCFAAFEHGAEGIEELLDQVQSVL
mmetsp:Transcript_117841/g.329975  ORF Transcript_117841/g.329975 Transcript_117841/m.329975 type:complete len:297 (+) Transcript_117841:86-976(+)